MPDALVASDVQSRFDAGELPAWMASLKQEHGLSCAQLGDVVSRVVDSARSYAEGDGQGTDAESWWLRYYGDGSTSNTWEVLETLNELQKFQEWADAATQTLTIPDVEIFTVGEWNGDEYTEADLRKMVEAFDEVGFEPPLKLGHSEKQKLVQEDGLPSVGWVSKLAAVKGKLVATFSGVPRKIAKLIDAGGYKQRSAEIYWNFKDTINGRVWPRVLKAVSLIGADVPAVKGMPGLSTLDAYLELYCHGEEPQDEAQVKIAGFNFTEDTEVSGDTDNKDQVADASAIKQMAEELAAMKVRQEALESENKALTERVHVSEARGQAEAVEFFIATAKKDGKLAPKEEAAARRFAQTLDQSKVHKFTDGDETVEKTQWEAFKDLVNSRDTAFTTTSESREGNPDEDTRGSSETRSYAGKEFDETAYTKAYSEALESGMDAGEAYERAKKVGWGQKVSALQTSKGGDS